jgi:hypothetical protein
VLEHEADAVSLTRTAADLAPRMSGCGSGLQCMSSMPHLGGG